MNNCNNNNNSNSNGVTLYDYGRIVFAIIVPVLSRIYGKINNVYLVFYTLIFIYSVGLPILRRQIPAVKIYTKFFIITDTILIFLLLFLIQNNSTFKFLYLFQILYFLIVVLLLFKAWEKERKANREIINKLTKRVQNVRDTYEISKFLRFPETNLNFIEEKIEAYKKTFAKSLFALERLQDNDTVRDNNLQDKQEKLLNTVSGLLARSLRAETCLIALFDGEEKITVKGSFGDRHFDVGTTLDHRDGIVYLTKMRNHPTIADQHSPKELKKFNGIKFNNLISLPINSGTNILGIITLINKRTEDFDSYERFNTEDQLVLISLANQISLVIENQLLFKVQKDTFVTTIRSLVQALDTRDPYTRGHSEQVAQYAVMIAKEMGLSEIEIDNIRFAGLLHDIGKIGIPEKLLNKPGKLTLNEFNQIKMHPYISAQILKPIPLCTSLLPFIYHHHERWDGKGYPDGLKGEEIPLGARILAVADSFDAMIADRVYRQGKGKDVAVNELVKYAACQFDPMVVDAFLTAVEKQMFEEKVDSVWKFDSLSNVFRDVLNAVTSGQLVISDDNEINKLKQEGEILGEAVVKRPEDIGKTRLAVKEVLQKYKVPEQEINKILLCISEVTTNMLKHASGGRIMWCLCNDGKIRFVAEDSGPGLRLSDLPKATLVKGPKKKKALGFTVLLELLNKVYLKTNDYGTTLVLEQRFDQSHAE